MPYFQNKSTSGEQAGAIVERLCGIYDKYVKDCRERAGSKKGLSQMFGGWFTPHGGEPEPLHQSFLDGVEDTVSQLADVLSRMEEEAREPYAAEAVACVMRTPEVMNNTSPYWYALAARYYIMPILPFLSSGDLRRERDAFLKSTPKRMMLPKERELFNKMEEQLAGKAGRG